MNETEVVDALKRHGLEKDEFFSVLAEHRERALSEVRALPGGDLGDDRRIRELSNVLRQALLHRSTFLIQAAGQALAHENGYSLALNVRAHFETTAGLGYLHRRLSSMKLGNVTAEAVDKDICTQLLGSRDEDILEIEPAIKLEAKQILTMLEHADKSVSTHVMGGGPNEHDMLTDIYKWLCEFCHPNFHSNSLAFRLNRANGVFRFRHDDQLKNSEANILNNLFISGPIFVRLFDDIEQLLP